MYVEYKKLRNFWVLNMKRFTSSRLINTVVSFKRFAHQTRRRLGGFAGGCHVAIGEKYREGTTGATIAERCAPPIAKCSGIWEPAKSLGFF